MNKKFIILLTAIFFAFSLSTFIIFKNKKDTLPISPTPLDIPQATPQATPPPLPDNTNTLDVLLLGYGGAGHDGGFLTDAILLAHLDFTKNNLTLIHIPRDLYIKYPDGVERKINAAFALKSKSEQYPTQNITQNESWQAGAYLKEVIYTITGFKPLYFIAADFNGFISAIDSLKGLDVKVTEAFGDDFYPVKGKELDPCDHTPEEITELSAKYSGFELEKQFACRYESIQYTVGTHHLTGNDALKYSRSRHSGSDFTRGKRQQTIILALKDKLFSLKALDKVPDFYKQLSKSIRTDITLETLVKIAPSLKNIPQFTIKQIGISTDNVLVSSKAASGAFVLIPQSDTKTYIQQQVNN